MELSENFRIQNNSEVNSYITSRGFNLFKTLLPQLKNVVSQKKLNEDEDEWQKTQIDENWVVRVKEIKDQDQDYCQYEIFSEINHPTEPYLDKLQNEAQLFCHPKLMEY